MIKIQLIKSFLERDIMLILPSIDISYQYNPMKTVRIHKKTLLDPRNHLQKN